MTYRVIRKKFSELQKGIVIVEEVVEAADVTVIDGALVFLGGEDGTTLAIIPAGAWLEVEVEAAKPGAALITPYPGFPKE